MENEKIDSIFFFINGKSSFVLPRYNNIEFVNITGGSCFGTIDIIGSMENLKLPIN